MNHRVKSLANAAILICLVLAAGQSLQAADSAPGAPVDTTKFEQIFVFGLQGDMSQGLKFLDSLERSSLTPRQLDLQQKFYARFRTMDEVPSYRSTDTAIDRLIDIYRDYWRKGLLKIDSIASYDTALAEAITDFLKTHDEAVKEIAPLTISDDFPRYLREFLQKRGVFSAVGKTGMYFDLLLHAKETETNYAVTTPEETVQVKVIFMENTISNGWEEYATFGKYFPGGWATNEALYCAKESYDTAGENFKVSYLKHEGKHFADYRRFPKLTAADLEYRAKLVELAAAQETLYDLIKSFSRNSGFDRYNSHAFANHCVIRDLAKACGLRPDGDSLAAWKNTPVPEIHARAEELLRENSLDLTRAGADTVSEFIK